MEVMVESLHHVIDQLTGVFLALLGEVEIEHSGFELGMAHVALDDAQVDTGFEEVGGVGMAQRVYGNSLFSDAGIKLGATESALDTTFSHGSLSLRCPLAASAKGGEDKTGMAVGEPVAAQELKRRLGQREVAILGALTTVDMDHHALTIDIGDFEMESFVESEAAGVDGEEIGVVVEGFDVGKKASDFIDA
jgi:hypothetical protein